MIDFKPLAAPRLGYVHPTELRLPSGEGWFNGKIADSDSVNAGSNPGPPATNPPDIASYFWFWQSLELPQNFRRFRPYGYYGGSYSYGYPYHRNYGYYN